MWTRGLMRCSNSGKHFNLSFGAPIIVVGVFFCGGGGRDGLGTPYPIN
jgi:hypothetical protein